MNERSQDSYFLHVDGDSFFAACELTLRPDLVGRAVVVGEDRGIAVAMNQEAKKLGITRGMPTFKIKRYFPQVVILSHHFDLYRTISKKVFAILLSYVDRVEEYSIDECFAVVKPSDIRFYGSGEKMIEVMKKEISDAVGVTYSFGLARTKALAKTASKLEKPNGCVILATHEDEIAALKNTKIDSVWGIGWRTQPVMKELGLKTAYDFACYPSEYIQKHFSEPMLVLQQELLGNPINDVHDNVDPRDQKSIQSTCTFRPSSDDPIIIWAEIAENTEAACEHARRLGLLSNSISCYVKTAEFKFHSVDLKLPLYTTDPGTILNAMEKIFPKLLIYGEKIRATGVTLHGLVREECAPRDLFGKQDDTISNLVVEKIADDLRKKFGRNSIKRASSLKGSGKEMDSSFT